MEVSFTDFGMFHKENEILVSDNYVKQARRAQSRPKGPQARSRAPEGPQTSSFRIFCNWHPSDFLKSVVVGKPIGNLLLS